MTRNSTALRCFQLGTRQRGFTLLEVLIVITIVGIIVGVTTLSFGALDQRRLASDASRLHLAFNQAADTALMKQQTLGWFYREEENDYWFSLLNENGAWMPSNEPLFSPYPINAPTTISVEPTDQRAETNTHEGEPSLLFLASGEYTPFEIKVLDNKHSPIKLKGDGFGEITTLLGTP
ncbi:MAG: type II secretion system minor pseudopilin GspH [Porticoccus sp.]|nr:type II secretion system minor pseudopilin GspH [Porticoccus sp.]